MSILSARTSVKAQHQSVEAVLAGPVTLRGAEHVIEIDAISRRDGSGRTSVWALRAASLAVPAGQFVAVMGATGSGKSTLAAVSPGRLRRHRNPARCRPRRRRHARHHTGDNPKGAPMEIVTAVS